MKKKTNSLIVLLMVLMLALTACAGNTATSSNDASAASSVSASETTGTTGNTTTQATTEESSVSALPTEDRAGNPITVPAEINRIVSMSPASTQLLESFGLMDKLVAVDTQSPTYVKGLGELPQFDMMKPDAEALTALKPDIVFVSGMSSSKGDNPFKPLTDAGLCVVCVPSSDSIEGVEKDIQFTADCLGKSEEGKTIISKMATEIDKIKAIGATIKDKKTVMFEISALPSIYSFGSGTFLNEMIEIAGARNVFADQKSWISVTEESAIAANPDVILTNVSYIKDSVGEILSRKGWGDMKAIRSKSVYYVDNGLSSIPNQHIVEALKQVAKAVYPDAYSAID